MNTDANDEKQIANNFVCSFLYLGNKNNREFVVDRLTNLAKIHIQYAPTIVGVVKQHITRVLSCDTILPTMYLIDSMARADETYKDLFESHIVNIFCEVFKKLDERGREDLYVLRHTWNAIFSPQVLYDLDVHLRVLDQEWLDTTAPKSERKSLVTSKRPVSVKSSVLKRKCRSPKLSERQARLITNKTDRSKSLVVKSKLPVNILAAACLGVHQFISIVYAAHEISSSRGPRNPFLKERMEKGRFHKTFNNLLECEDTFKEHFHMDRETFFCLYEMVRSLLEPKKKTRPKDQITPKEKFAVVLEFFACGTMQRDIASVYNISKQHFGQILDDVCNAICLALKDEIPELSEEGMRETAYTFLKWNFPNCVGAIEAKHVSAKFPPKSERNSNNYKGSPRIVLMAVANGDYQFTYVDMGVYGTEDIANVFKDCSLGKAMSQNILPFPKQKTKSTPYVFVADDAFPLHHRIMKPYKPTESTPLDESEHLFNYRIIRPSRCVDNAFGILCSKNHCLLKTMTCGSERAKKIIKACAHLHNFQMRNRKEKYCPPNYADTEALSGEVIDGNFRKKLPEDSLYRSNFNVTFKGRRQDCGETVRDSIKKYISSKKGSVLWQRMLPAKTPSKLSN